VLTPSAVAISSIHNPLFFYSLALPRVRLSVTYRADRLLNSSGVQKAFRSLVNLRKSREQQRQLFTKSSTKETAPGRLEHSEEFVEEICG
jgi:hypothetical protein